VIYGSPAAFRQALEERLGERSKATGANLQWLRRRVVFERILVRLQEPEEPGWVLKGAMAIELRIQGRTRTTRDLDLALLVELVDGETVWEVLGRALQADLPGDGFDLVVAGEELLSPDQAGRTGWRFRVDARLGGRLFERVRLDVVARGEEIVGTTTLRVETLLDFAGLPSFDVHAVDARQHFAEKLHALTRDYGAPSGRVRDLPDLLLLIHGGLAPDHELHRVVEHVFSVRGTHAVPEGLPEPPAGWEPEYRRFARELALTEATVAEAMRAVRSFWSRTLAAVHKET